MTQWTNYARHAKTVGIQVTQALIIIRFVT